MTEQNVLRGILSDRRTYELFRDYGDSESISPIARCIVGLVGEYYGADACVQHCDDSVIVERAARQLSNPKHAEAVKRAIGDLPESVSHGNIIHDILDLKRRGIGGKLSLALANGARADEISGLIEEYKAVPTANKPSLGVVGLVDGILRAKERPENLIRVYPKELHLRLDGGVRRGHHILVFARPEKGKTLFTINMAAGFLRQGLTVLYIGNEEPHEDILARFIGRLLKRAGAKHDLRNRPDELAEALTGLKLGKLHLAEGAVRHFREARAMVKEYKPAVVIFDQIRNMEVSNDSKAGQLEAAGSEARAVGREENVVVVSLTQAGSSAEGKIYLGLNDVADSKTGLPGAVDLAIGLGADAAMEQSGLLGVSLPKNKLSGLHDNFTVTYDRQTGVILN